MKRKFKKCMSGAMAVALLFTAAPSKTMAGSIPVSSDNVIEQENVTLSGDDASISNNREDIENRDMSEETTTLNESVTIADELENEDASDTAEVNVPETDQAGAGTEDVTASFIDQKFMDAVREKLNLGDDAPITRNDCFQVEELDVSDRGIESLAGIENFTNLQQLNCSYNQLKELAVDKCAKLEKLQCGNNFLADLDISGCTELVDLQCGPVIWGWGPNGNILENLDVSNCTKLRRLDCSYNQLKDLDVTKCTKLEELQCERNFLTDLDVSDCTELVTLRCGFDTSGNNLENLDVSNCTKLQYLYCDGNFLTSLDVSNCKDLRTLYCRNNFFESLDVSNAINLRELRFANNFITEIDLRKCENLENFWCDHNQLKALDLSNCKKLKILNCEYNNMKNPNDVKGTGDALESFWFEPQNKDSETTEGEDVTEFFADDNFRMEIRKALNIGKNDPIMSNACINIRALSLGYKPIRSLAGIEYLTGLEMLDCSNVKFESTILDMGNCPNLQWLRCHDNHLTKLNVSLCPKLRYLDCRYNMMKSRNDVKGGKGQVIFDPQRGGTKKSQNFTVTPNALKLYVGGKPQSLKASNAIGAVTYSSSDPKVAKVDATGKVTPISKGTAAITVKAAGNSLYKEAIVKINVTVNSKPAALKTQNLKVKPKSLKLYAGGKAQNLNASNAKGEVTYISSKPKVAKVNSHGKVTPISKGTATITIKAAGNKSYKAAAVQVMVTVYGRPAAVKKVKATRTNKNRSLKVTWKKTPSASGYIIKYSYHKSMKNSRTVQIFKGGVTSKTLKNIKPKKVVYVQVQAYAKKGGLTIPGDWSKIIKSEPAKEKAVSGNKTAK